jgi:hypothetical protein
MTRYSRKKAQKNTRWCAWPLWFFAVVNFVFIRVHWWFVFRILWIPITAVLILYVNARPARGAEAPSDQRPTVIVVVGAGGTPEYKAQFTEWAGLWKKACRKGHADFAEIGLDKVQEPNDRTRLQELLAHESRQGDEALWLVLIGHGTFDSKTAKFNLRGPDVSAHDLAGWLKPFSRPLVVINTASSSAPFLSTLSAPGRVIVTATKSGFEQNYTRFGQYLAGAVADPMADLDKDGQTSLLEAFLTASARVDQFYAAAGRLATEHALLDDNGDGLGTRADWFRGTRPIRKAEGGASPDGYRAAQFCIVRSEVENRMPPKLRAQRDRLELDVVKLRDNKDKFSEDEYFSKLEKVLYEIALIYEQTDGSQKSRDVEGQTAGDEHHESGR